MLVLGQDEKAKYPFLADAGEYLKEHIHLIESVKLFTEVNKQIFEKIISKLKLEEQISINEN